MVLVCNIAVSLDFYQKMNFNSLLSCKLLRFLGSSMSVFLKSI